MREIISHSAEETKKTGWKLAQGLGVGQTICLFGELGSGKTTFVQGFAQYFGIKRIISPTFILERSYNLGGKTLYHLDLYRLTEKREIEDLGFSQLVNDPKAIVLIEWPEKIIGLLPKKRIEIYFEYLTDQERKIIIKDGK